MRDAKNVVTAWALLSDAYGEAREVPVLIEQLATSPTPDVWDDLWGHLCHQGTVYSASYAALPLLLEHAETTADKFSALHLIGAIIASENFVRVDCRPADLIDDIAKRARPLIEACMAKDRPDTVSHPHREHTLGPPCSGLRTFPGSIPERR